jgi:hypothetical protein
MILKNLKVSQRVLQKLWQKHQVTHDEIEQCFLNRIKGLLTDKRLNHVTDPPTQWFIAETDKGRQLKVIFIKLLDGTYEIKSAYEPNLTEVNIYEKHA